MAHDDDRLVLQNTRGQITIALVRATYRHKGEVATIEINVEDDSGGDSETGFGGDATAILTLPQAAEVRDFLADVLRKLSGEITSAPPSDPPSPL